MPAPTMTVSQGLHQWIAGSSTPPAPCRKSKSQPSLAWVTCCGEELGVAARGVGVSGHPCSLACGELFFRYQKVEASPGHVEHDLVAGLHQRQRPADERLGRDVQHARPVRRAGHARVARSAPCRARPARAASSGSGACPTPACPGRPAARRCAARAPSRRRRPAPGRRCAPTCRRSPRRRPRGRVCCSNDRRGRGVLDHAAVGRQRAAQDREARLGRQGVRARPDDVVVEDLGAAPATPTRTRPGDGRHVVQIEPGHERRADRPPRRSPASGTCPTGGGWRAPGTRPGELVEAVQRRAGRRPGRPSRSGG